MFIYTLPVTCDMVLANAVADPGFPVGGAWTSWGGVDFRGSYISKILYAKTKESGPLGGRAPGNCQCRSATEMYQ